MSLAQDFLDNLALLSEAEDKPDYAGKNYGVEFSENPDGTVSGSFLIPAKLKSVKIGGGIYYQYVADDFTVDPTDAPVIAPTSDASQSPAVVVDNSQVVTSIASGASTPSQVTDTSSAQA